MCFDLYLSNNKKTYKDMVFDGLPNQLHSLLKVKVYFEIDACNTFQKSWDRGNLGLIAMWQVEIRRWCETGEAIV